ncbi:hypothetical protein FRC10_002974 [Ceratobasidium sp. 414]|nr:hypothetical protein FRC10_002974 [Ceratobasidium sp. 414]
MLVAKTPMENGSQGVPELLAALLRRGLAGPVTATGGSHRRCCWRLAGRPRHHGSTWATGGPSGSGSRSHRADVLNTRSATRGSSPSTGASAGVGASSREPEHRDLLMEVLTQRSNDFETWDRATLAAELAKYVEFDCSTLSSQDIQALL